MSNKLKTTQFGESLYPHLTKPDYAFNQEGLYQVKLKVKKEEAQEDIKAINEVISFEVAEHHKKHPGDTKLLKRAPLPYETEGDFIIFKFKLKASGINGKTREPFTQKPTLVDHNVEPIPSDKTIWGGSIMRITYEPIGYNVATTGIGCTLRLKGAQIKKLVEGQSNTGGFDKVDPVVVEGNY